MTGKTYFQNAWLLDDNFKDWLIADPKDKTVFRCLYCHGYDTSKSMSLSNMGIRALHSHMDSRRKSSGTSKHSINKEAYLLKQKSQSTLTSIFCKPKVSDRVTIQNNNNNLVSGTITSYNADNLLSAAIIWACRSVWHNYSAHSNRDISETLKAMFPGSSIFDNFTCGEQKTKYITEYGIAPYFKEIQQMKMSGKMFTYMFDESLCIINDKKQFDAYVRYWDDQIQQVAVEYFDSAFIGIGKADVLVDVFDEMTTNVNVKNMLQIGMDGPHVNLDFHTKIENHISEPDGPLIINIGSCTLHKVNNCFQKGHLETEWNIHTLLKAMYKFLKKCPARREHFEKATNQSDYPVHFCNTRWLENGPAADRAIQLFPHFCTFVQYLEKNKSIVKSSHVWFCIIKSAVLDKMTVSKLHFFSFLSTQFEPFLRQFQTEKPMVPFMASSLISLIRGLMECVVKSEVLKNADTAKKLMKIDIKDSDNLLVYSKIKIGYSTEKCVKTLLSNKEISDRDVLSFKKDCKSAIIVCLEYLLINCPLKYDLVLNAVSLNPIYIGNKPKSAKSLFYKLLSNIEDKKRIMAKEVDSINSLYSDFVDVYVSKNLTLFTEYDNNNSRLDDFYVKHMSTNKEYTALFHVIKLILVLSHGNADPERGFSMNKHVLVDNLQENGIKTKRRIHDVLKNVGGPLNIKIDAKMLSHCSSAHSKYKLYLEEQKIQKKNLHDQESIDSEISTLTKKQAVLESELISLNGIGDDLAEQADKGNDINKFKAFLSVRKRAKEAESALKDVVSEIENKKKRLKFTF